MANRVLLIGIDGGDWGILSPFIDKGIMPNLSRCLEKGEKGVLISTFPPTTPVAWASLHTGVLPQKHLIYDFLRYQPGTYRAEVVDSLSIRIKTVWEILSDFNLKIILIGLPLTYPPKRLRGVVVSGFLTPGLHTQFTYPQSLQYELLYKWKDYKFFIPATLFFRKGLRIFIRELISNLNRHRDLTSFILCKYSWDLAVVHFQSPDSLQHALIPLLDPSSSHYLQEKWRLISEFYKSLDEAIGRLIKIGGKDTNILIFSDHGFTPLREIIYLNRWLRLKGYLKIESSLRANLILNLLRVMRKIDVFNLRYLLSNVRTQESMMNSLTRRGIDWQKSYAYMFSGSQSGHLYINLKGREPQGTISRSSYLGLRERLRSDLEEIKNCKSRESVIKRVYLREEIVPFYTDAIPDLMVEPQEGYVFSSILHHKSIFRVPLLGKERVGAHSQKGIYLFQGPDFKTDAESSMHITDIPATILKYFRIDIPSYFDGLPRLRT